MKKNLLKLSLVFALAMGTSMTLTSCGGEKTEEATEEGEKKCEEGKCEEGKCEGDKKCEEGKKCEGDKKCEAADSAAAQ